MSVEDLNAARQLLEATDRYRIISRFLPLDRYGAPEDGEKVGVGFIVDTETTSLSPDAEIIEFGGVLFEYGMQTGCVYSILETISCLQEPVQPISPEASAVNGITSEMVAGQSLDDAAIEAAIERAGIVIAHNAKFDRPLLERRYPMFAKRAWACSINDVSWASHGITGTKLDYILFRLGFYMEGAHRALNDCQALLHVLAQPSSDDATFLSECLASARRTKFCVAAVGDTYPVKDTLNARGYRWQDDVRGKFWVREVDAWEPEREFLATLGAVYPRVELVTARTRYSNRAGALVDTSSPKELAPAPLPLPVAA